MKVKIKPLVEAALFMANKPVSIENLSKMLKRKPEPIKEVIENLKEEFKDETHGIYILETKEGYQIRVKPEYVSRVRTLTPYKDLNRGLLRVLALVAYKQPITQSQIVKVIGNRAYEYVKRLEQKGLLRTEKFSRTKALFVTKEFANYFGLERPEDAKKFFEEMSENENRNEQPRSNVSVD